MVGSYCWQYEQAAYHVYGYISLAVLSNGTKDFVKRWTVADEILEGLIDFHIKNGQYENFVKVGEYHVDELATRDSSEKARLKTADWKLTEGNQLLANNNPQKARRLFLEAVQVDSFQTLLILFKYLETAKHWG